MGWGGLGWVLFGFCFLFELGVLGGVGGFVCYVVCLVFWFVLVITLLVWVGCRGLCVAWFLVCDGVVGILGFSLLGGVGII